MLDANKHYTKAWIDDSRTICLTAIQKVNCVVLRDMCLYMFTERNFMDKSKMFIAVTSNDLLKD